MTYGTGVYGGGSYGGAAETISIDGAFAISTHGIRVLLTSEPMHSDEFADGDALNVATWEVQNNATTQILTVIAASMHDDTSVDLVVLEALGDHLEEHIVGAIGLLSVDGFALTSPEFALFDGVVHTMDPVERVRSEDFRDRDLANPPFQTDRGLGAAGTLSIGDDGDFATEAGTPLIRKLVLRRMNTPRGAFRHLPDYGVEIAEKEPIASGGDLQLILRDIEQQAQQEPDVDRAVAHGSLDRSGVAIIMLAIQPSGGATINLRMGAVHGRLVEI